MKTKNINQRGSHLAAVVLVVCFVGLVVFVGYKVIAGHKVAVDTKTEAQAPAATAPAITVPAGWTLLADKDIGIQFVYPAGAGAFVKPTQNDATFESSLVSGRYSGIVPGVDGSFTLGSYKSATSAVSSRRYGPKVKLSGSQWIVTEPNQYDTATYRKGDVYPEITHVNARGIDVYTAITGDEGVIQYNLFFVSKNKLRELELPAFDSGAYSSTYNFNDQGPYDAMYAQIRDSISLY